jgi:sodium-dependent dicarboxylate transporter 2/3/5
MVPSADTPTKVKSESRSPIKQAGLLFGLAAFVLLILFVPEQLPLPAQRLIPIMGLVIVFWVTEAIPMPATALLGAALCILLGVAPDRQVLAPFGHPVIFLYLGTFFLAAAMNKHGLDRRLALTLLGIPGLARSPRRVFAAVAVFTAALSMWMNNLSTTAVMLPIALGIMNSCPALAGTPRARESFVLLIAFSASIGGMGTPIGTAPNLVTLAFLRELTGERVSMVRWMLLTAPIVVTLLTFVIWRLVPRVGPEGAAGLEDELRRQRGSLGAWKTGEIVTGVVLGSAVLLWFVPGVAELAGHRNHPVMAWLERRLSQEMIGLWAGLALFLVPTDWRRGEFVFTWRDAAKIDWGTLILVAGGLTLGSMIFSTGLADALGQTVGGMLGTPSIWMVMLAGLVMGALLSEVASNTASANVMVPLMIAVAHSLDVNPVPVALAACLGCTCGYTMPVSTGPNALAYGTREVRLQAMLRHGVELNLVSLVAIWLTLLLLAPVLGWL